MLNPHLIIIGSFFSFLGSLRYLILTLQGKVKPNRVSYFMWSLAPLVAFAAEVDAGVGFPALLTFMVGFNPLTIFIASFFNRKAVWSLTKFDVICGVLSLLGFCLWIITGRGNLAVAFGVIADALASVPTIRKSYRYPDTEYWGSYFGGFVNAVIALLIIKDWQFAAYAFPAYIVCVNSTITSLIYFRPGAKFSRQG